MTFSPNSSTLTTSDVTVFEAPSISVLIAICIVNAGSEDAVINYLKVVNSSNVLKYYILYNRTIIANGDGIESSHKFGMSTGDKLIGKLSSGASVTIAITAMV